MKRARYVAMVLALHAAGAAANEIVYTPVNPSFGGNPLNGPALLNTANAVNKHQDPALAGLNALLDPNSLEGFNARLQGLILDQIANAALSGVIQNGQLVPGTFVDAGNFRVQITSNNGVLSVTTIDKTTGASTTFQVSQ
jgi:curli production assembly/transport component CsgF